MLISATVLLAVLVGVGVVAFLHSGGSNSAQGGRVRLSNKITSQQSVGLANLGRTGQAGSSGSSSTLLSGGAGGLVFTPSSGGESVQSSQQWQADEMGSGGFVLLFSASGRVPDRGRPRRPGHRPDWAAATPHSTSAGITPSCTPTRRAATTGSSGAPPTGAAWG